MARVLITGCAGFMGSHLAERLVARGDTVIGIDNFDDFYPRPVKEANLAGLQAGERFRLIELDIRDGDAVGAVFDEAPVDWVLHWAAKAGVPPSLKEPNEYVAVNVEGTVNVLEAARQHEGARVIFASSSSVYGVRNPLPYREDADISRPLSPYAATKVAGEALCHCYHHLYGLPIMCLRLFNVYGPRQRPDLAMNLFAHRMARNETITLFGDGSTSRDYTYVDDVVDAVLAAMGVDFGFEILNIGSGRPIRLDDMVKALEAAMGVHATLDRKPERAGDMVHTFADTARARQLLGWQPRWTIEDGLRSFLDWMRTQPTSAEGAEHADGC